MRDKNNNEIAIGDWVFIWSNLLNKIGNKPYKIAHIDQQQFEIAVIINKGHKLHVINTQHLVKASNEEVILSKLES